MREAIGEEYKEFIKYLGKVEQDINPMDWWRTREKEFPKLSLYWKAHSSYPATSASAERLFNMDGLIFTLQRYIIFNYNYNVFYSFNCFFFTIV